MADRRVLLVGEAAFRVHIGLAVAERRARVHAHAEVVDQTRVALPVAAQAADVDHGRRAVPERVQKDEGAQRRHRVRRRRRHRALERRREAHVVRRAVVVLRHVQQQIVAAATRRVHVGIDEARADELAARGDRLIDAARVGAARVHDRVVVDHDAAALVDFVTPAVVGDDPAALDERFHAWTSCGGAAAANARDLSGGQAPKS